MFLSWLLIRILAAALITISPSWYPSSLLILNDIKLIEDAINDAVLDIKKNKEGKSKKW